MKQKNRETEATGHKDLIGGLAHVITEIPAPANWRPRRASGVIQGEFKGLRTTAADGVNRLRAGGKSHAPPE